MEFQALILSLLLSIPAHADGEDAAPLAGEVEQSQPAEMSQPVGDFEAPAENVDTWTPPPGYDQKKTAPPRFTLAEKERALRYLNGLCALEPVHLEESRRARVDGRKISLVHARNKQGSLRLLLENYVDSFRAAGSPRHFQGSHAAWLSAGGGTGLPAAQLAQRERSLKALQTEFYELRDASQLDGKAASVPQAEKVLAALRNESSCGLRSVKISH